MRSSQKHLLLAASLAVVLPSPGQAKKQIVVRHERVAVAHQTLRHNKTAAAREAEAAELQAPPRSLAVDVSLADVGYPDGFRLSNLGGQHEIYIPVPEGTELKSADLVLVLDDISAHDARRNLQVLVNDRLVSAISLDGKSTDRTIRTPLADVVARDGFVKLSFLYSGAATQDRCIDVRYVGDSLTVRPESAVEFNLGTTAPPDIAATVALMPRKVAILLSNPTPPAADIATALALARSLSATGRKVTFYHGVGTLPELVTSEDRRVWTRGLIVVGAFNQLPSSFNAPTTILASAAGAIPTDDRLAAIRVGDVPVLLVADTGSLPAEPLLRNPSLAALRGAPSASIGKVTPLQGPRDRVSFDELGLAPAPVDVFGRADLSVAIASRTLPSGTRPSRLLLDVMVAPDGAGEKAVVSTFVNERLLASTVAATGEPTRLDFALPNGLVGTAANIRVLVERRSAQGNCRFEPQGYPAQILGSSSVILSPAGSTAEDFSDLTAAWSKSVEVLIPASAAARPLTVIGLVANVLDSLSKLSAPIAVKFVDAGAVPTPDGPFIALSNEPPAGAAQRVRFDRGRIIVTDRVGRTRLDIGGLTSGAVAQIVTAGTYPGLWIKPLSANGSLPVSAAVDLDRGDVAFLDKTGVALALSTERDTLLQISYPDHASWLTFVERFRSWIIGGVWTLITLVILFTLQRLYRRPRTHSDDE